MEKLKAIIVDDELDAIEILRSILTDTGKVEVLAEITDVFKVEAALNRLPADVLFLDIEMPGNNGLNLLENIREYNQDIKVVFVTAYDKYISTAIKLNVFSYLLKPVEIDEIEKLIDKILQSKVNKIITPTKIKIPIKNGNIYLWPNEIIQLRADGNYTNIFTVKNEKYTSSYNMGRLSQLLEGTNFLRINRSCILNCDYLFKIDKLESKCYVRIGEQEHEFHVSKSFIKELNRGSLVF